MFRKSAPPLTPPHHDPAGLWRGESIIPLIDNSSHQTWVRYISPLPRKIKIIRFGGQKTPPLYRDSRIVPSWRGGWGVRLMSLMLVIALTACSAIPDDGNNNNAQ